MSERTVAVVDTNVLLNLATPGVDDEKNSRERVALAHEKFESYDPSNYETQLVRDVESMLAPFVWDRNDIRRELNGTRVVGITDGT